MGNYPHGHHESVLRSHGWRTASNSAGYLLSSLKPDMRVLDVGCGPGSITTDLATKVPQGEVVGLEPTSDPFEEGYKLATARGVDNVSFQVGDARKLPFSDGTFDVVHTHQVLQYLNADDRTKAIREMRRVTKPGGLVAIREADQATVTFYPEINGLTEFVDLYRKVARANGGEADAGRRLHAWVKEAGFAPSDITATAGTWCYHTPEERAWWSGSWSDRILHSTWAKNVVESRHASQEDLNRLAEAWRTWGANEDGWYGIMHGEVLCRVR
ncbi:MAG: hypothetical protein L6R39_005138 [Caloplaca ligustica]|nr:MAG: hypothetical protein L6R39_005138 [Caloplaca ligustica]